MPTVTSKADRIRNVVVAAVPDAAGLQLVTLYSPALKRRADITLYLPKADRGTSLPLLILMHGVYGSHWNWWLLGNAPAIAAEMLAAREIGPFAIAMPSDGLWGDGSGYVTHRDCNAESWIMRDVPQAVATACEAVESDRIYLAGQSMGGYGALRLGAKHASRVAAISAHSPVTSLEELAVHVQEPLKDYLHAGKRDAEILYWIRKNRPQLPPIRFDCGAEDALLAGNRALHQALKREKTPHIYEEHPGGHDWEYWRRHVRDTFRFVSKIMYPKLDATV